jgi:hypothetical protein
MPESKIPVRTFLVDYACDRCSVGKMCKAGVVKTMMPPLYQHKCSEPSCGYLQDFHESYPSVRYEEIK